ncbi:MAG: hypothetical protein QOF41_433 [Methylobacteriaceae bacterium]|nr:hypothetical protein [Methylobacteriaceae bacterium]
MLDGVSVLLEVVLEDAPEGSKLQRIRLRARIALGQTHRTCGVIPDGFFGQFIADETESYFMYEKDRGEMPIMRYKSLYGTYVAKKLLTYYEASRQGRHLQELGIPNFRVLMETTTPDRVEQMLRAIEGFTNGQGSNIFLFVDQATLGASTPFDALWTTGKRDAVRLTN